MLTKISLEYFKCFKKINLPVKPLTLLSGINATGKSTILQALAILHQTITESEWSHALILNSETISLGTASDVIDKISGRREFVIGLESDTFECQWIMEAEDRFSLSVPIRQISWREAENWEKIDISLDGGQKHLQRLLPLNFLEHSENARQLSSLLSGLTYLSAERLGPRETYMVSSPDQHGNVGPQGERTPWYLEQFSDKQPLPGLMRGNAPPTLQRQSESWLQHFFPGASFDIQPVANTNLVTLGMRTSNATDFHRPQNVGYGLTHVLPILVACLGAGEGNLVLIENPEAHLHPSAQAEMGEFLARCSGSGVQIILETHSDHILNGIRRAVKKRILSPDQISIHFFRPRQEDENNEVDRVFSPVIGQDGNLSSWPENFFDQFEKDTDFLLGWGE